MCEQCGNNCRDGFFNMCNSVINPNPDSFNNSLNFSDYTPQPQYQMYSCELYGNDAHYGYDCLLQVPFIHNLDPCFNQNFDYFPQTLPNFQQYICCTRCRGSHETFQCDQLIFDEPYCENCGGLHETFQCQPINQNYYEPNPCYDSSYSGFDQIEPPQFPVIHQPPQEMSIQDMEDLKQQYLDEMKTLINEKDYRNGRIDIEIKINELKGNFNEMSIEINKKKKLQQQEQVASRHFNSFCYDDDDDEEYTIVITPEKPVDSLIMEEEHLDTIPETESDEFIKSSIENHVPTPSESEDFSDIESECDVPNCDDSQTTNFSTFSNPLFDDSTSSDDESSHEEVIHEMSFKTYLNPLFDLDEEIISSEFNPIHNEDLDSTPKDVRFNAESYLLESLVNHDTLMASPPKIDFLLDEFAGELTRLQSIPPGIDNINLDPEGDILFLESLLYDNSSPRPPEAFQDNSNTIIESLPTFPIPVEDSDSLREEIDIFPGPDDSIPPGIESDDFDSEDDDNSTSLPEFDSFHVDYPNSGDSTIDVVEDIPVDVPNILPTHPTLHMDFDFIPSNDLGSDHDVSSPSRNKNKIYDPGICIKVESTRFLATLSPVIDTLLPFSFENEDKVFNHGVLASKNKYPPSSSHRGFKASKLFLQKSPMLIHGDNTPNLGVRHPYFYPP
ncbi:hypothetical protein Tco_1069703 [Tanacetum coccineum]|uniref:Uncharacterized protein n=1 Tax=Tanacetum coccineum TaxID=301880 RepID=A0ABQ5HKS3_9ASTR